MPLTLEQRERVLEAISIGRLLLDAPVKMYTGYGVGRPCDGCKDAISAQDVEYEANFSDGGSYFFHLGCAGLWDVERRRLSVVEDARMIREQAQLTRQQARLTAKESAQLRDEADVISRESEVARERARQVKRGEQPGK